MTKNPSFPSTFKSSAKSLRDSILYHLKFSMAHDVGTATKRDWWLATSRAAQERIIERMLATQAVHNDQDVRRVYYLSLEFLMGRLFSSSLFNAGIHNEMQEALQELGLDLADLAGEEYDMGLGNGGLGRLAACFLDSLATLDYPAIGYGIHYEFGLFKQEFSNGHQIELPDDWMKFGTPWEIVRPEYTQAVELYGSVENVFNDQGDYLPRWVNTRKIIGVPYDIPIPGFGTTTVNFLRLWESRPSEKINLEAFNRGGYSEALAEKTHSETVSKVLYPNDKTEAGKELRLVQQYFFISCSLRDIIRRFRKVPRAWSDFSAKVAIQLNDTHPALAVVELLRILQDEERLPWQEAWDIVSETFAYTNHTLLPEALEKWSVPLFQKVLPRHLQLVYEINRRLLESVEARWPGDAEKKAAMSLIEEGDVQRVRMAHIAVVGSHSVNGVAALHTELLQRHLFADFNQFYVTKFNNKTNGITPRRWLLEANPRLAQLISERLGDGWVKDLDQLRGLEKFADEPDFQRQFMEIKRANKVDLAAFVQQECGVALNPDALFDVQIKRLHEYKRQHLNLLHIVALYRRILQNPNLEVQPRAFIFAAKAAPGYDLAKCIIHAINAVGAKINSDPRVGDKLKVAFIPNYRVSVAERIIPAADLSEQISTAGKEASGTGNMKLALNGALTIGTLDGANVEILEEVGPENIFIFGLTVDQVEKVVREGYRPQDYYYADEELRAVVDWIGSNYFTPDEPGALHSLQHSWIEGGDPYLCLADFRAYCEAQARADAVYRNPAQWARMAIMNTARVGKFSSDRTIHEYARDIWKLPQVVV
jgi:starch phosphorylase